MLKRVLIGLASFTTFAVGLDRVQAQTTFKSGYYEITSGFFSECCGFAGNEFVYELPDERQALVELIIDPGGSTARLAFLTDLQRVFSYPWITGGWTPDRWSPTRTFAFSFSDGIVLPDRIQFGDGPPARFPGVPDWNYAVRDLGGNLGISGVGVTPMFGADTPNEFQHTDVIATLVPNPVVIDRIERQGGSMLFHFTGRQLLYDYIVEFSDSLTTPNWQTHSRYRAKLDPVDVVVTNSLSEAQTRYFRIRTEPCNCR